MKQTEFVPTFRDDGSIDPQCFEQAGLRRLRRWLRDRLSGVDPYLPIDTRSDEDPEALIVSILRDAGLAHPASSLICRVVAQLLDEAGQRAPKTPAYFPSAIRLCQRIRMPQTSGWFTEAVEELAASAAKAAERWGGYEPAKEVIFAAIVQAPGLPTAASRKSWQTLMKQPRYATLALLGLGHSFCEQVKHLRDWWRYCPAGERPAELDQLIFGALKTEGEEHAIAALNSVGSSFPRELKAAISRALRANGARQAFVVPAQQALTHSS